MVSLACIKGPEMWMWSPDSKVGNIMGLENQFFQAIYK